MSERPPCKQLFLLVGSNPLPNFLAAIILKPESVCLFYTPETAPVKNRLKDALQKRSNGWKITEQPITDAADSINIQESVRKQLTSVAHLHYTGGTKPMAAHALMAFHDAGGTDDQASYLDEKKGILRFDDENVTPIDLSKENLGLTIREILGLHGINVESIGSEQKPDSDFPTAKDAEIIAANVIKEPALARKLYEHFRDKDGNPLNVTEAKKDKLYLHDYFPGLSINEYPLEKWNSEKYKKWRIFFESAWLEYWCGELVKSIVKKDDTVSVDIQCKRLDKTERECQIDVAVIRGHRLYVISCTTEAEEAHICKNKLFEVAVRARQLGGDLARAAMVSLIHGTIKQKKQGELRDVLKIDLLKGDIADLWESSNEIKACGLENVRAWIGTYGDPKVHDLKKWLES